MKRIFITIYILLLGTLLIIPFGIGPIIEELFEEEVMRADQDISKGTFYLLAQQLEGLDHEAQKAALAELQPKFGYPIALTHISRVVVEEDYREAFLSGRIVDTEEDDILVMRMGQSEYALAMGGPWPGEKLEIKATILFLVFFVIFLTVPAMAWTFFLIRDIRKIEKTASRFAAGFHDARVRVSKISSVTAIAAAFNTMAHKTQKLIASQKDLANSVSHEIRTPLARIKFSLEMAGDETDSKATDYIREIGRDVEEIESLVDEMLTYARFEREPEHSGRLSNHEMVSWLQGLVSQEQKTCGDVGIVFDSPADHCIARFEPVYLGWAVRNLLRNGVRHSRSRVALVFDPHNTRVYIHVDDDGPGIPETARRKIFQPFFRLDQSRSRASGGYGLGLAIAKRITDWHRGDIRVSDSPLGGARFTLMIPILEEEVTRKQ